MGDFRYTTTEQYYQMNLTKMLFSGLEPFQTKYGTFSAIYTGYTSHMHPYRNEKKGQGAVLMENLVNVDTGEVLIPGYFWLNNSGAIQLANLGIGAEIKFEAKSKLYSTNRYHSASPIRCPIELFRLVYARNITSEGYVCDYANPVDTREVIRLHDRKVFNTIEDFFNDWNIVNTEMKEEYIIQLIDMEYKKLWLNRNGNLNCDSIKPKVAFLDTYNTWSIEEQELF